MSSPTSLNDDLKNLSNKQQDTYFGLYDIAFEERKFIDYFL